MEDNEYLTETSPNFRIVFAQNQISIDVQNQINKTDSKERNNYWKNRLSFILMPLIITGAPVHHLVFNKNLNYSTTKQWLKSMFVPKFNKFYWFCVPINVILMIYAIFINLILLIPSILFLKNLMIDGILSSGLIFQIIGLIEMIPYIVTINLLWLKGYKFRELINSFDSDFDIINESKVELNHTIKIGLLYILLIFSEVTQISIRSERKRYCQVKYNEYENQNYNGSSPLCKNTSTYELIDHLIVDTSYYLIIILYIVICWVIYFNI